MKPSFISLIFISPNVKFNMMDKVLATAKEQGYTMYSFNGIVRSTTDNNVLFTLSDLLTDK